jgi:hypothetical protein
MSASIHPFIPVRKEIQGLISSCEMLLSSSVLFEHAPLSSQEQKIVLYYSEQLKAYLDASGIH